MKVRVSVLACVALLLLPRGVRADPVTVVSGNLLTQAFASYAPFTLIGEDGTTFSGRWPNYSSGCAPCLQGTPFAFSSNFVYFGTPFVGGEPFASGTATVNGVTYPSLFFSGALQFSATASPIPDFQTTSTDLQHFTFTQPFTFSGTVSGFDRLEQGPMDLSPLFTSSLTGTGTATIDLVGAYANGRTVLNYSRTTYDFAPTPEPVTLMLLAVGLSVFGVRQFGRYALRRA